MLRILHFAAWVGTSIVSSRVIGIPASPPLAYRMDSMAEHEPYETPHGSLRTAAKAAAK